MFLLYFLQIQKVRDEVSTLANSNIGDVRIVVSPYRVCPLGAHIDHQVGFLVPTKLRMYFLSFSNVMYMLDKILVDSELLEIVNIREFSGFIAFCS